ncbi:hypothetical protein GCM10023194_05440 [Planotetraspora phitsanulokensis]|uniref:Uncharacterized protein n=2 Tax=Planotetraspora phitsanulokensis TaxID=575192 RepID=A0A8J3U6F8_9ACTN|nr:hypothetical protein Pph01_40430 [Planotetraspora phitsanulokensis]
MTLQGVEQLVGPFHDRMKDSKPRRWRPRLHFWEDLELLICHGSVLDIGVPLWRERVALPAALSGWQGPQPALLHMLDVLNALNQVGAEWEPAPGIVLGDEALGIRTHPHDVRLVFAPDDSSDTPRLHKIHKSDCRVDLENHSPRQGGNTP